MVVVNCCRDGENGCRSFIGGHRGRFQLADDATWQSFFTAGANRVVQRAIVLAEPVVYGHGAIVDPAACQGRCCDSRLSPVDWPTFPLGHGVGKSVVYANGGQPVGCYSVKPDMDSQPVIDAATDSPHRGWS